MARLGYQYGTSPRKLEPDYTRRTTRNTRQRQLKLLKKIPKEASKNF